VSKKGDGLYCESKRGEGKILPTPKGEKENSGYGTDRVKKRKGGERITNCLPPALLTGRKERGREKKKGLLLIPFLRSEKKRERLSEGPRAKEENHATISTKY